MKHTTSSTDSYKLAVTFTQLQHVSAQMNNEKIFVQPKPRLSHSEKFTEKNKILYFQFKNLLQIKLKIDSAAIEDEKEKV